MKFLTDEQIAGLRPAETTSFASPVPTQIVSSDEYLPVPQTEEQRRVEGVLKDLSGDLARKLGMSRRRFFETAAGMAAAFVALNQVFGPIFDASPAEAATPEMANERASKLSGQFIIDGHTHFLRDDTRLTGFVKMRNAFGKLGWNKELTGRADLGRPEIQELHQGGLSRQRHQDSAVVELAVRRAAGLVHPASDRCSQTREKVNKEAGTRRMMAHFTITPGQPGWLDQVDQAIEIYKPDSWKGYTVGDNTHKELAHWPWHADDEKLMYPFYEKAAKAGIKNVCIHKGLFAPGVEKQFPRLRPYADVSDIGKAAKDWPQLNFLVYHSAYRWVGGTPADGMAEFDATGRSSWTSDLAEIPQKYGVTNVYGDLGQIFAWTAVAEPRLAAALMGMLVKGLRPRPRRLGHRRGVDRGAAMADRRAAPPRNPGGHAKEIRLCSARSG